MRRLWLTLSLLWASVAFGQDPVLEKAIQVVRDWLGDPQAEVLYERSEQTPLDLEGPQNHFIFNTDRYRVEVDVDTMEVTGWWLRLETYAESAQIDRPMLSIDQIKNIALNYARQHFPHWNEFPYWEFGFVYPLTATNWDNTKEALIYIVSLGPYFINDAGQKIPVLTTGIGVSVDPYSGEVVGFSYSHMPMTLTSLTPSFSAEEAKVIIEEAFRKLGAARVKAVMSADSEDSIYSDVPDGLVIGATQTSELRLAYAFDYVETVGAPGYEDVFGDGSWTVCFRAAIDAHTGELFYLQYYSGMVGSDEISESEGKSKSALNSQGYLWLVPLGAGLLISVFLLVIWKRNKRKTL